VVQVRKTVASFKQWQLQLEHAARCIQVLGRNKLSGDLRMMRVLQLAVQGRGKGTRPFAASGTGTDACEGSNFSDDGGFDAWEMNHT
jgi:hypothetical protein